MKKTAKIISVSLVLAMVLSLFSGLMVFAEDTPSEPPTLTIGSNAYIVKGTEGAMLTIPQNASGFSLEFSYSMNPEKADIDAASVAIESEFFTQLGGDISLANGTLTIPQLKYSGNGNTIKVTITGADGVALMNTTTFTIKECEVPAAPEATPTPTPEPTPEPTPVPEDLPKIMVKDFSFGSSSVEAGKEFELKLNLFTTSGNTSLSDVMVGLNFGELKGVALASGSMNTYVGAMGPNATRQITYKIITDATIEPGAIGITIQITSKNGEPSSSPISIPVTQPERFEITNIETPETMMLGEEGYLSVTFVNKGKSPVNNLSAEIQGVNLANPGQSQFLGNIAAGTENSVDFSVMASEIGVINGRVILSYEDSKGDVKTLEKEFSCTVEEMPIWDDGMMDPGMDIPGMGEEPKAGMPWWGWVLLVIAVVGIAVAVIIVVKQKKAKKQEVLEEDDDEDI